MLAQSYCRGMKYLPNPLFTSHFRKTLKERLGVPQRVTIGYEVHDDTISRKGSVAKNTYSL